MAARGGEALRRLGWGGAISLVAALALLALMFQQWYGVGFTHEPATLEYLNLFTSNHDAWHALGAALIVVLLLVVAATIGVSLARLAGTGRKPGAVVCVGGGLAALAIVYGVISPPDLHGELEGWVWDATLKLPIFLALCFALAIAVGGWLTWWAEGT